jgi:hypothetical protein
MVLVDEAFSKMDESRSREVIDYLTGSLGLQLLTRVLVDRKECNRNRIADLWTRHRRTVRQQAELDFMAEVDTGSDARCCATSPPDSMRGGTTAERVSKGQVDPVLTGCAYADSVLLPAIRRLGRRDQESR